MHYMLILLVFLLLWITLRNRKAVTAKKVMQKRKREDKPEMIELAKRFIGKECLISSFDSSHQFAGTIREVSDSAILIENRGGMEAVNLDFVIRIREYPKNKRGRKLSIVPD